jgi:hypothetical protein
VLTVASLGPDPTKEFQKVSWEAASLSHPAVAGVLLDTSCSPLARAATSWLGSYYSRLGVPVHDNEIAWEQLYESQTPPVWMSSSSASECVLNLGPLPDQDDAMYEWCAYIRKRSDESLAAARKGLFQSGSTFVVTATVRAHAHMYTHTHAHPPVRTTKLTCTFTGRCEDREWHGAGDFRIPPRGVGFCGPPHL